MWKAQIGEQTQLWCTLLVFTQSDGQLFIESIIVNQAKEYYQYVHLNTPMNWMVHHK